MNKDDAIKLCGTFLPLWTGNRPEELVKIYSQDAFYRDPAKPGGVQGRQALLSYFRKLLAAFPDWVWTADDVFPIDGGFALRWKAVIPAGGSVVKETGLDLIHVKDGLITRNEVYFDRAALLAAMTKRN